MLHGKLHGVTHWLFVGPIVSVWPHEPLLGLGTNNGQTLEKSDSNLQLNQPTERCGRCGHKVVMMQAMDGNIKHFLSRLDILD